jgi:hypothetical protein
MKEWRNYTMLNLSHVQQYLFTKLKIEPTVKSDVEYDEAREGKSKMVGEDVEYIFSDARHINPMCRVTPIEFIKQGQGFDYDKEKYREMVLEAAETVLGYFGFDRTAYGDSPKKNKKWWHEIHEERTRNREAERI